MNFVNSLDLFGVPAKEIPCVTGTGAPTTATEGAVGSLYMDTNTGEMYKCTKAVGGVYTWNAVGGAGAYIITGTFAELLPGDFEVRLNNFDFDEMVEAIKANRPVAIRVKDVDDGFVYLNFHFVYYSFEDVYASFVCDNEPGLLIDVFNSGDVDVHVYGDDNVSYYPQAKTEAEKARARENIGAAAEGECAYIIKASKAWDDDAETSVITLVKFDHGEMVKAIRAELYVAVRVTDEDDEYVYEFPFSHYEDDTKDTIFTRPKLEGIEHLTIHEDGSLDVISKENKDPYIITGRFLADENDELTLVTPDDPFYYSMVKAIQAGRYVAARLVADTQDKTLEFVVKHWSDIDREIIFQQVVSPTLTRGFTVHSDSTVEVWNKRATGRELLWENPDVIEGVTQPFAEQFVKIPNLSDYERIEIAHVSDDTAYLSQSFDADLLEKWSGCLSVFNDDTYYSRRFNSYEENGIPGISFSYGASAGDVVGIACVPVCIYGIKL